MKAKSIVCFLCMCFVVIALAGCAPNQPSVNQTKPEASTMGTTQAEQDINETQPTQEKSDPNYDFFDTFNIVCEENPNYKLLTNADGTGYCYYVYDNAGVLLDSGYHDYRDCSFSFKDGYLSYYNAGLTFTRYERYYDVENGRISPFYYRPLGTHKNLVAYYGPNSEDETVLIIRDMFDKQTYYCEFAREFGPSVLTGGSTGSFSEDGTTFTVTYIATDHENKTDTEVTETIQLP